MNTFVQLGEAVSAEEAGSPDWVRISYASALALRFKSGQFTRELDFGGINLLLSYPEGCVSDCSYCGLAASREGRYEDKSFIRVEWPLVSTDELVERLARYEDRTTRLCISMVTHGHAYRDTLDIIRRIRSRVSTPLSVLVAPPTLNEEKLLALREAGADMIGIGLDAVTEELFRTHRTDVPKGRLEWKQYWEVVHQAREIFGPWTVNCHLLVGLGESDRELMQRFERLLQRQIFSYLFSFNPEPDSRLADHPRSPVTRWRRVQLAKFLLEECGFELDAFDFDPSGGLKTIVAPPEQVEKVIAEGYAFMTNGCPGAGGEPGCTRPMGSWRPGDSPRDFPWQPDEVDRGSIRSELRLEELLVPGRGPSRPAEQWAPPAAGR